MGTYIIYLSIIYMSINYLYKCRYKYDKKDSYNDLEV